MCGCGGAVAQLETKHLAKYWCQYSSVYDNDTNLGIKNAQGILIKVNLKLI